MLKESKNQLKLWFIAGAFIVDSMAEVVLGGWSKSDVLTGYIQTLSFLVTVRFVFDLTRDPVDRNTTF